MVGTVLQVLLSQFSPSLHQSLANHASSGNKPPAVIAQTGSVTPNEQQTTERAELLGSASILPLQPLHDPGALIQEM